MNLSVNQEILNEIINQDYSSITKTIEEFLKNQVSQNNSKGLIFGLSGGVDSAVTAYLCNRFFPKESLALLMPDSKISPKDEDLMLTSSEGMPIINLLEAPSQTTDSTGPNPTVLSIDAESPSKSRSNEVKASETEPHSLVFPANHKRPS